MRSFSQFLFCVVVLFAAACPELAQAKGKGGKGGGGGGRPSFAGGGGGGHKFSQQGKSGGGKHDLAQSGKGQSGKEHKDKLSDKTTKASDKSTKSDDKLASKKDGSTGTSTDSGETYNKKQKQLEIEQRNRDKRLAQAEHLRQIAERNGNENLAANADRMEAFAHDHYARRVEQLEKFGVTDPTLDPGIVTDPLTDPAGEFTELPLLP